MYHELMKSLYYVHALVRSYLGGTPSCAQYAVDTIYICSHNQDLGAKRWRATLISVARPDRYSICSQIERKAIELSVLHT